LLINDQANGENACYVVHSFAKKEEFLVNDSGSGSRPLGNAPSITNTQCSLIKNGSAAVVTNNEVAVSFHVHFNDTFRGTKHLYAIAQNSTGGTQGPTKAGYWDMWDVR
jgi:hypothetical protein